MKFKFKICFIIILLLFFTISHVYAMELFLDQSSNSSVSQTDNFENNDSYTDNVDDSLNENKDNYQDYDTTYSEPVETIGAETPTVTKTSTVHDNSLSVSDIINIILIALCIVLILLGIAILIKFK